jgi:hypothetical protein
MFILKRWGIYFSYDVIKDCKVGPRNKQIDTSATIAEMIHCQTQNPKLYCWVFPEMLMVTQAVKKCPLFMESLLRHSQNPPLGNIFNPVDSSPQSHTNIFQYLPPPMYTLVSLLETFWRGTYFRICVTILLEEFMFGLLTSIFKLFFLS